jgi:hyperosmotically inducible periplasmic protein
MGGGAKRRPVKSQRSTTILRRSTMQMRTKIASALTVFALVALSGCAVTRGQETTGAYVDDTAITTAVKARYVGNKEVDATAISVETLNGTVMLSGFAKNQNERTTAEDIAMKTNGVKSVKNAIVVRP